MPVVSRDSYMASFELDYGSHVGRVVGIASLVGAGMAQLGATNVPVSVPLPLGNTKL